MSDIIMGIPREKRIYDMSPIVLQGLQHCHFGAYCPNCGNLLAMRSTRDKFHTSYYCSGCDKDVNISDDDIIDIS